MPGSSGMKIGVDAFRKVASFAVLNKMLRFSQFKQLERERSFGFSALTYMRNFELINVLV